MHLNKKDIRDRENGGHEDRAYNRTQNRSRPSDDDKEDGVKGPVEFQHGFGVDVKDIYAVEAAAEAGKKCSDG